VNPHSHKAVRLSFCACRWGSGKGGEIEWNLTLAEALEVEYRRGMETVATGELFGGLERYASGDWRKGRP